MCLKWNDEGFWFANALFKRPRESSAFFRVFELRVFRVEIDRKIVFTQNDFRRILINRLSDVRRKVQTSGKGLGQQASILGTKGRWFFFFLNERRVTP